MERAGGGMRLDRWHERRRARKKHFEASGQTGRVGRGRPGRVGATTWRAVRAASAGDAGGREA